MIPRAKEECGMGYRSNWTVNRLGPCRRSIANVLIASTVIMAISFTIKSAAAQPEKEVRATFDGFVAAQNAHDIKAVEASLLASPDFLWITRGMPVWGHDAALKRFTALYEGTWRLDPEPSGVKITMISDGVAQVYIPIIFTIGATGQAAQQTKFLMNQVLVKTADGWRVSSILPIPVPPQ